MRILKFFIIFLVSVCFITAAAAESVKGDVNRDGKVTSVDALMALQMSVGKIEKSAIADLNGDGRVTSFDAFKILRIAVGVETATLDEIANILSSKGFAKFFGDERMNWEIRMKDGRIVYYSIVTENGLIKEINEGKFSNPTLNGFVSEETIEKIKNSEDWVKAAKLAFDNGEIRIEGVGMVNQIKIRLVSFISKWADFS